jgi:hypothetical protein
VHVRRAVAALLFVGLTACVSPARSYDAYESKAASTAEEALAAIGTAQLTLRAAVSRKAFAPYLTVLVAEAEDEASAVQGTFDGIQPPDARSDDLQQALDKILEDAGSVLQDLRIAARRSELPAAEAKKQELDHVYEQLDDFIEEHG